uniref:Uncharacterized protein n=1 Tax=Arundo donax TaxID=35708 RepID=A0A0A9GZQ4_ARUDO
MLPHHHLQSNNSKAVDIAFLRYSHCVCQFWSHVAI